jgi:hypothetical protein
VVATVEDAVAVGAIMTRSSYGGGSGGGREPRAVTFALTWGLAFLEGERKHSITSFPYLPL